MILVVTGVDERYSVFFWELYPESEVDLLIDCFWGIFRKAFNFFCIVILLCDYSEVSQNEPTKT